MGVSEDMVVLVDGAGTRLVGDCSFCCLAARAVFVVMCLFGGGAFAERHFLPVEVRRERQEIQSLSPFDTILGSRVGKMLLGTRTAPDLSVPMVDELVLSIPISEQDNLYLVSPGGRIMRVLDLD